MSRNLISISAAAALIGGSAIGDVPNVAVDIGPVHSLVASIMEGVGVPNLVIQTGASPHNHRLRPSEAKALQDADIVFWIGENLTPWMKDAVETLASDASITTLLEADGTILLNFRESVLFESHENDKHDENGHGSRDPHAWLSPENAKIWLNIIAAQLSTADPENAGTYFANAASVRSEIEVMSAEIDTMLDPIRGHKFVVFHDAYQYFEKAFNFFASGAIVLGDASKPSPARIAEIQERVRNERIGCVLAEPQFNKGIVAAVMEGSRAETGVIDPLGVGLDNGPKLYIKLIRNMAKTLSDCL